MELTEVRKFEATPEGEPKMEAMERGHIRRYLDEVDSMSVALNEASLLDTFGARDAKMNAYINSWENRTGANCERIKQEDFGRK